MRLVTLGEALLSTFSSRYMHLLGLKILVNIALCPFQYLQNAAVTAVANDQYRYSKD